MALHNLKDAVGVLQGLVTEGLAFSIGLILPGCLIIFPKAISIVIYKPREQAVQISGAFKLRHDQRSSVGVIQDILLAYIKLFTVVAVLILFIAGINFVNLATARSARRAREVGIRKIVGSLKRQLVGQFLGESILLSLFALVLAIGLIQAALPFYRSMTGRVLSVPFFGSPFVIPGLLVLALVVGLLAGLYPAFFLSSFKHADVLRGSTLAGRGRRSLFLRSGLVVFQFVMSLLLIIGSLVIFRQLDFIKNQRLGFDKDNAVVAMPTPLANP